MKITEEQFKILQNLDEQGQLHLVDQEIQDQYRTIIRLIEIKTAGIEVEYVPTSDRISTQTLFGGLPIPDDVDASEVQNDRMVLTPFGTLDCTLKPDTLDLDRKQQAPVPLASARRSFNPFRRR